QQFLAPGRVGEALLDVGLVAPPTGDGAAPRPGLVVLEEDVAQGLVVAVIVAHDAFDAGVGALVEVRRDLDAGLPAPVVAQGGELVDAAEVGVVAGGGEVGADAPGVDAGALALEVGDDVDV